MCRRPPHVTATMAPYQTLRIGTGLGANPGRRPRGAHPMADNRWRLPVRKHGRLDMGKAGKAGWCGTSLAAPGLLASQREGADAEPTWSPGQRPLRDARCAIWGGGGGAANRRPGAGSVARYGAHGRAEESARHVTRSEHCYYSPEANVFNAASLVASSVSLPRPGKELAFCPRMPVMTYATNDLQLYGHLL